MRDHDVDLEGIASPRHREQKDEGDHAHGGGAEVGKAIGARRPDALGAAGMLHLQRAAGNAGIGSLMAQRKEDEESPVKEVVRSSGSPLDKETKHDMEGRFGQDFSDVQVHTDGKAADSAQSVSAQAYTVGNHVVFNEGKYQPDTPEGKHMIAHELTHVVQQRNGPVDGTSAGGGIKVSDPSDRFEREADSNARNLLSSPAPVQTTASAGSSVQRQEDEKEEPAQDVAGEKPADETPAEDKKEDEVSTMAIQRAEAEGAEEEKETEVSEMAMQRDQGAEEEAEESGE